MMSSFGRLRLHRLVPVSRALSSAAPAPVKVDKEALSKLRKRTGYSFVNCRKALVQFGPDKLEEAEKWLKELAKKEGWAKAAKLSSRATTQGLVGVASAGDFGAIVELTCETDFVARGDNFKALLESLTLSTLNHAKNQVQLSSATISVSNFDLEALKMTDGRTFKEVLAEAVGKLGENITIKKVQGYRSPGDSSLFSSAHPKEGTTEVQMGKFASIVAIRREKAEGLFPTDKLAAQICQHIIGMRSESLGTPPVAQHKEEKSEIAQEGSDDELNEFFQGQTTHIDEDETALLRQSFMLNPSQTVHEYITGHHAQVLDFVRTELGGEQNE